MRLFRDQAIAHGIALILITHDLGVVAQVCDKILVMYAGNLVEYGDVETIFKEPKHPYTKALLACIPVMGMEKGSLSAIEGNVPNALNFPSGCRYHTRCPNVTPLCKELAPQLIGIDDGAKVACHNY